MQAAASVSGGFLEDAAPEFDDFLAEAAAELSKPSPAAARPTKRRQKLSVESAASVLLVSDRLTAADRWRTIVAVAWNRKGTLHTREPRITLLGLRRSSWRQGVRDCDMLSIGDSMAGRLLIWDFLSGTQRTVRVQPDPNCPLCGKSATAPVLSDSAP